MGTDTLLHLVGKRVCPFERDGRRGMCAFGSALQKEILEQISSQTSGLVSVGYLMAKGG